MTITEKYIIETYSNLFNALSPLSKSKLLDKLKNSLHKENKDKEKEFFKSFGAFGSNKSAEVISKEIKESRAFKHSDLKL